MKVAVCFTFLFALSSTAVAAPTKPRLTISVPDQKRAIVRVTLTNPTLEPYVLAGSPWLTVYSKPVSLEVR